MLKRWIALCLSVGFVGLACAQQPPVAHATETPHTPPAASPAFSSGQPTSETQGSGPLFLWQVTGPVGNAHVLGSVHVAASDLYPLDPRIEAAFTRSDYLVLETDLDSPEFAEVMTHFVKQALLPPGKTVFDELDAALGARLRERMAQLSLAPAQVEGFQPWFVALTLSMAQLSKAGFTGDNGIDAHFQRQAKLRKMPILTLEPLQLQMQLLLDMGASGGIQDIQLALDTDAAEELRLAMVHWQYGDTAGLNQELEEMRAKAPIVYDAMFTQRNKGMAQGISKLLQKPGNYFVVVGAGHLVGEGSVVQLLQGTAMPGIRVQQVGAALTGPALTGPEQSPATDPNSGH